MIPGASGAATTGTAITWVVADDSKLSIVARHEIDNMKTTGIEDLENCMARRLENWSRLRIHGTESIF